MMDFTIQIGDEELVFTQFNDLIDYIKQHLAQWNNFEDVTKPVIIMVGKRPSDTPSIGVNATESVEAYDVFGGLPEKWNDAQKELFLKLNRMAEEHGQEAVRDYIRNQGKRTS